MVQATTVSAPMIFDICHARRYSVPPAPIVTSSGRTPSSNAPLACSGARLGAGDDDAAGCRFEVKDIHRRRADEARGEHRLRPRIEMSGAAVLLDLPSRIRIT